MSSKYWYLHIWHLQNINVIYLFEDYTLTQRKKKDSIVMFKPLKKSRKGGDKVPTLWNSKLHLFIASSVHECLHQIWQEDIECVVLRHHLCIFQFPCILFSFFLYLPL